MRGIKYIKYSNLENCNEESVKKIGYEFENNVKIHINDVECNVCGGLMWLRERNRE
jgi:hypothetical protein